MRRRLDPDDRKREIIRAASRAFAARPFDEVHLDEIAADANASRALINHYFRDKRGLFAAVLWAIIEQTPAAVRTDLAATSPEEMVAANTTAWLDLVEARREVALMFLGGGPVGRDPEIEAARDELRDRLARRMFSNHFGEAEISPTALTALRAELGLIERAMHDLIDQDGANRARVQVLVERSILATVRDFLPAMEAAEDEAGGESDGMKGVS